MHALAQQCWKTGANDFNSVSTFGPFQRTKVLFNACWSKVKAFKLFQHLFNILSTRFNMLKRGWQTLSTLSFNEIERMFKQMLKPFARAFRRRHRSQISSNKGWCYYNTHNFSGTWSCHSENQVRIRLSRLPSGNFAELLFESGLEEELKRAPHGNRKDDSQPFIRTASSAMIHRKDQCSRNQKVEHDVWKGQGGMAWVENTSKVPRSRQQIYDIKRDNVAALHCSVDAVTFWK